jgi:hypothetical protein
MFRSHSLIALPVLLLPLYGAATALPQAGQTARPEIAESVCVTGTDEPPVALANGEQPEQPANEVSAIPDEPQRTRERSADH